MINHYHESLWSAVIHNNIDEVEKALKEGQPINEVDDLGRSYLLVATMNGDIDLARLLVAYGADVNQPAKNLGYPFFICWCKWAN